MIKILYLCVILLGLACISLALTIHQVKNEIKLCRKLYETMSENVSKNNSVTMGVLQNLFDELDTFSEKMSKKFARTNNSFVARFQENEKKISNLEKEIKNNKENNDD